MTDWPEWARQGEAPICVRGTFTYWYRPDEMPFDFALYADGTIICDWGVVGNYTAEMMRQIQAGIEFGGSWFDAGEWEAARHLANIRATRQDGRPR